MIIDNDIFYLKNNSDNYNHHKYNDNNSLLSVFFFNRKLCQL